MKSFLLSLVAGVLPSLLRLIAASLEGYFEGFFDSDKKEGDKE